MYIKVVWPDLFYAPTDHCTFSSVRNSISVISFKLRPAWRILLCFLILAICTREQARQSHSGVWGNILAGSPNIFTRPFWGENFWIIYYARKQLLLSARLSHRNSVCLSVCHRVDQSKTVQARITKSSPSAAWKTLVLGTVKLFHKFEGDHHERGR